MRKFDFKVEVHSESRDVIASVPLRWFCHCFNVGNEKMEIMKTSNPEYFFNDGNSGQNYIRLNVTRTLYSKIPISCSYLRNRYEVEALLNRADFIGHRTKYKSAGIDVMGAG